jgi:hypothetical protein
MSPSRRVAPTPTRLGSQRGLIASAFGLHASNVESLRPPGLTPTTRRARVLPSQPRCLRWERWFGRLSWTCELPEARPLCLMPAATGALARSGAGHGGRPREAGRGAQSPDGL